MHQRVVLIILSVKNVSGRSTNSSFENVLCRYHRLKDLEILLFKMTEVEKRINKTQDRKAYDKQYNKAYYKEHRNYWLDYHECLCGSRFNMSHKSRHGFKKTPKFHQHPN